MTLSPATTAQGQQLPIFKNLHTFNGDDGALLYGGLTQGSDGNFYGTTYSGGDIGCGTAFKITPDGGFTVLHTLGKSEGCQSYGGLVQGADGNFYGTASGGGAVGGGSIYQLTPTGLLTVLHNFNGGDGNTPTSAPVIGADGSFYGTTSQDGPAGGGTVYKLTTQGEYTILHAFNGTDGLHVYGGLVFGQDGNLYGVTADGGGENAHGTVYRVTTMGGYQVLHVFTGSDGYYPQATLVQGSDGNFYGTTNSGGAYNYGTVYRITRTGTFTTLHSFDDRTEGASPIGSLIQGSDGNFYGNLSDHGSPDYVRTAFGKIYRITPAGAVTILHSFVRSEGYNPQTPLVMDQEGNFYGTTTCDGGGPLGTIFKLERMPMPSSFFAGQVELDNEVFYLSFANQNYFGYYAYLSDARYVYHFGLGYEYVLDANDGTGGVYFYDFGSGHFFYTSPTFPFPYLYDFTLRAVLLYYPSFGSPTPANVRYFYNFATGEYITQ